MGSSTDARSLQLVAPAGSLEKLVVAVQYGADAVYFGGKEYSLRSQAANLTDEEMVEGIAYCRRLGVKAFITLNAIPHNHDLPAISNCVRRWADYEPDAFIVSDPGVVCICRDVAPSIPIHLSTQANAINWMSVSFWMKQGVSRVVLARELRLDEIKEIRQRCRVELEVFVHGAMCISYSGRCLLSYYLTGRNANLGSCAQPCRWRYHLIEETRPGEALTIEEDDRGAYILNSKDLCMIRHLPDLVDAGVTALKIEGRMKSTHYVATVTRAYRRAIDALRGGSYTPELADDLFVELQKVSHRGYTTGFYLGSPSSADHNYESSVYLRTHDYVGIVSRVTDSGEAVIEVKNRLVQGEEIEFMSPHLPDFTILMPEMVREVMSDDGEIVRETIAEAHANYVVHVRLPRPVEPFTMLRRDMSRDTR